MNPNTRRRLALLSLLLTPLIAVAQTETPAAPASPETPAPAEPTPAPETVPEPAPSPAAVIETPVEPAPPPATPAPAATELSPLPAAPATEAVAPAAPVAPEKAKDTLSVDFPDEDIRNILRNVADLFELNIVMPDTLQGRTSIKLRDVTWRQIFKVVLSPVGYTFVEDDNIIKIVTNESLSQEPLHTEVFILNYARAEEIQASIKTLVVSPGAQVQVDKRINALIISERPSILGRVMPVLKDLDKATDQVMIESKFVEVTNRDIRNIGVNWASLQNYQIGASELSRERIQTNTRGNNRSVDTTDGISDINTSSSEIVTGTSPSTTNTIASESITTNAVDRLAQLTRENEISTITSSVFSASDFNIILSALKTNNETRLVSNPTIVTLNNTEANISIGEEYPIPSYQYNQERGSFEVSGFDYKNIGILLKVTPQVNARRFIRLLLEPEVSSQAGETSFGGASGATIPIIATRKTKTQVTLKDGYTMGIGGLVERTDIKGETKVPLLGSIPGLGHLFRSKSNNETARNLLVFITAKTVNPDGAPVGEIFDPRVTRQMGLKEDQLPGYRDGSDPFGPSAEELAAAKKAEAKAAKKAAKSKAKATPEAEASR
jgi:type IV pilus assembly protein PilQ